MKIEIQEFYLKKNDKKNNSMYGSLHVYLEDFDIDMRGIQVMRRGKHWQFSYFHAKGIDDETGKEVYYPIFCFNDKARNKELFEFVETKGRGYIEKRLVEILEERKNKEKK